VRRYFTTLRAEFTREWTPPEGISEKKAQAALEVALSNATLKEIAKRVGISYGTLRNWHSQDPRFQKLVERIRYEFANKLQDHIEKEIRSRWREAEETGEVPDLSDLTPLFKDRFEYSGGLKRELADRAERLLEMLEREEKEEEALILADIASVLWWIAHGGEKSLEDTRSDLQLEVVSAYLAGWAKELKSKIEKVTSLSEEDREELRFFLTVVAELMGGE